MRKDVLDRVFRRYKKITNMSYTELLIWSKKPISKLASVNRKPIRRNLRILKKKKDQWTMKDIKDANKTISYLSRAKKRPRGKVISKGLTRNQISMMNWGFNFYK